MFSYAEEDYLKNNSFINGIFTEIRNLVSNSSETIQPILIMENDGNNVNISRSFDLSMIGKSISETKACYEKLTEMLRQIAGLLRIPHVTDGVPLRFMVSYMYGLLCDRLNVLEHFEEFFNVITIELAKVNGKLLRLKQNNYNVDDSRWESVSSEGDPTVNHQP
ncbi:hypothetical protein RDWZM_003517 [Blomia tropicalis]|uniref:Uncharacterized protein n=1 Tax=Blomia tropicalis TaxID=40697 RepID=A0A9Q0MID8_BLOTA|nr:hypothetical protein RDWZM_003517 [Blomia tropicalis]